MLPERAFRRNILLGLALFLGAPGCRTGLQDGVFAKPGVRYTVGPLPQGFQPVRLRDNDVAFTSDPADVSVAVNSTCEGYDDASLDVLTHQLLMGFTDVQKVDQRTEPLDGREALRTRVRAKLDGVPQELLFVVMKKNGCIFDLTYLGRPDAFEKGLSAFQALLARFHVEEP